MKGNCDLLMTLVGDSDLSKALEEDFHLLMKALNGYFSLKEALAEDGDLTKSQTEEL